LKIDLRSAYYLVCITQDNKWKTSFRIHYGSYKWLVMPFSLLNVPSMFQRFMNNVFSNLLDVCVVVYLDNILIYSDNIEDHTEHIREVLSRLQSNRLYASPLKYVFHQNKVGFVLSLEGLSMNIEKVKTNQDWPSPQ